MDLTSEFIRCWEWEVGFDLDTWWDSDPSENPTPEKAPHELAMLMIEDGLTLWHHMGWVKALFRGFEALLGKGKLIKARLFSDYLLTTIPENLLDGDIKPFLQAVSEGRFYDVYPDAWSSWPRNSEYYRKNLNFRVMFQAMDEELQTRANVRTAVLKKFKPHIFAPDSSEVSTS